MSEAISMAIAASGVEADHKGDTGLSAQHQLIMTCCWINIRVNEASPYWWMGELRPSYMYTGIC